mgnify:CR=1 FL=1
MEKVRNKNYWSPYIAGACAGLVLVLSVWFTGKYFGASTSFVRSAGLIEKIFSAERVSQMDYFVKTAPKIDWQWMFVVGIFIGAMIGMLAFGFSINMLTLFGMILAIGIVVDDAIVVIENTERNMTQFGLSPKEAAKRAMSEVSGALIAIVLVVKPSGLFSIYNP